MLVGYGGLVSLGHAGLFGIAGYAAGCMLAGRLRPSRRRSSAALVVSAGRDGGLAVLSLRATGIGFIMITLALGQILWGLAYRWISLTNGDNGINVHGRPAPFGFSSTRRAGVLLRDAGRVPASPSRRWRSSCARRSAPPDAARATSRAA